jgi:uncharacterized membrane protein (GlpM family)
VVERDRVFRMVESISISTYTIIAFFVSFLVLYYSSRSLHLSLAISIFTALLTLIYFRKRGVLLERAAKS